MIQNLQIQIIQTLLFFSSYIWEWYICCLLSTQLTGTHKYVVSKYPFSSFWWWKVFCVPSTVLEGPEINPWIKSTVWPGNIGSIQQHAWYCQDTSVLLHHCSQINYLSTPMYIHTPMYICDIYMSLQMYILN